MRQVRAFHARPVGEHLSSTALPQILCGDTFVGAVSFYKHSLKTYIVTE